MSKIAKEIMMLRNDGKPCMHSLVKLRADAGEKSTVHGGCAVWKYRYRGPQGDLHFFSNHFKNHICVVSLRLGSE